MIDRERLDELEADFGADELGEILAVFLREVEDAVTTVGDAGSDPAVWCDRLHFLKGCARMIGAVRLGDLCETLEAEAAFGPDGHARLLRELCAVRSALGKQPA